MMQSRLPARTTLLLIAAAVSMCFSSASPQITDVAAKGIESPYARAAIAAASVQQYYDPATGLFCSGGGDCWWWSANELTALVDYSREVKSKFALADVDHTYNLARFRGPQKDTIGPFLDTWNDDDGWWGLAWVDAYDYAAVYDPAHADRYLKLAENIFAYMASQWETGNCGGGLWQMQKPNHTKDAIANEVFLSLAASLALRTGDVMYSEWALREWRWFNASHMITPDHLVDDHLSAPGSTHPPPCTPQPQRGQFWTYNQGVILGGLTGLYELNKKTHPALAKDFLVRATEIADCATDHRCGGNAAISAFPLVDSSGILTEGCGTNPCTYAPSYQFKGIFIRNLAQLNKVTGKYKAFLAANASSVWVHDRNSNNIFGFYWNAGPPFYLPANGGPAVGGAALDALNTQLDSDDSDSIIASLRIACLRGRPM
jgi:predicted alpha-1,6-mannanase (GH76 family)